MSELTEYGLRWVFSPAGFRWLRQHEVNKAWLDDQTPWRDATTTSWDWKMIFGFTTSREQFPIKQLNENVTSTAPAVMRVFYLDVGEAVDGISNDAPVGAVLADSVAVGSLGIHPSNEGNRKQRFDFRTATAINDTFRQYFAARELIRGEIAPAKLSEIDYVLSRESKIVWTIPAAKHADYLLETLVGYQAGITPTYLGKTHAVCAYSVADSARCRVWCLPCKEGSGHDTLEACPVGWQAVSPNLRAGQRSKPPAKRRFIPASVNQRRSLDSTLVAVRDYFKAAVVGRTLELSEIRQRIEQSIL